MSLARRCSCLRSSRNFTIADGTSPGATDSVRAAALEAMQGKAPLEGPLQIRIGFTMPRPNTVPRARRNYPATKPDIDKLARAALDGLTGALYRDDSQVIELDAHKEYVGSGRSVTPGLEVQCRELRCRHEGGANRRGRCVDCGEVML
jgi:Holliday junction resolvase RusA-like endonuclease